MPTMIWFPEVLESADNWESWFQKPDNNVLFDNIDFRL
jgi:hypothetical protein